MIIKAAKRIFNSGKICHSYSDLNFGVTFFWDTVYMHKIEHTTTGAISVIRQNSVKCGNCSD